MKPQIIIVSKRGVVALVMLIMVIFEAIGFVADRDLYEEH